MKKHAALHDGELKRIDETISSIEERQRRMEEEYDESDENTGILAHEIESLEIERTRLILERAELANKEVMLRLLLELIDIMEGKSAQEDYLPACFDYDDFFRRTQYRPEEGIVVNGKIKKFDDGLVVRYLDKVIVNEDGYEVVLKGGVTGDVKAIGK